MAGTLWNTLFSPLGKEYCNYYLILCAIAALALGVTIVVEFMNLVRNYRKMNMHKIVRGLTVILNVFLAYLSTRIMYSVCVKAL